MNPLEELMAQLAAQSGSRGALFAGRRIPQGQAPDLKTLMTQLPTDIPEESYGMLPGMNPNMLMQAGTGQTMPTLAEAMRNYFIGASSAARQYEEAKRAR
jgi:hypothetical protein